MSELTTDDLQEVEAGLVQLRQQQQQLAVMVARQEGIVLYLRQRLKDGDTAEDTDKNEDG